MDEVQHRKAANEAVFRQVNEQVESLQRAFARTDQDLLHIVCECDRLQCADRLDVPLRVYESTRADSACFLVSPGHEDESVEDVIDTGSNYVIVRKRPGEPQEVASRTDPRS
jgi:hypothetical protein